MVQISASFVNLEMYDFSEKIFSTSKDFIIDKMYEMVISRKLLTICSKIV